MQANELECINAWVSVKNLLLSNKLHIGTLPITLDVNVEFNTTNKAVKLFDIINIDLAVIIINDLQHIVINTKNIYLKKQLYFKEDVEALTCNGSRNIQIKYVEQTKLFEDEK